MSASCSAPIAWEELVAFWADDLDQEATDRLEEHLMGCEVCSIASARVAAITGALHAMIPPFVSHARVLALRSSGTRFVENVARETERKTAIFPVGADVLLHRLVGLDLARAENVSMKVTNESTGELLLEDDRIPFDASTGEILVACQRHFGEYARTIVFEVRAHEATGATRVTTFAIPHVFEPRPGA